MAEPAAGFARCQVESDAHGRYDPWSIVRPSVPEEAGLALRCLSCLQVAVNVMFSSSLQA